MKNKKSKFPFVAILTDFGKDSHFVGLLKAVIFSINPNAKILDLCNDIESHNILGAYLIIWKSYKYFPRGTTFLCVVDPGVGGERIPICVEAEGYKFVGPDNGIFSFFTNNNIKHKVYELQNKSFFLPKVSHTFHGRDIFAPASAYLSMGIPPSKLGTKIKKMKIIDFPKPHFENDKLVGEVIWFDKFGNIVTNISEFDLSRFSGISKKCCFDSISVLFRDEEIQGIKSSYDSVKKNELVAIIGSLEFLEISANMGSGKKILKAEVGDEVAIKFSKKDLECR